MTSYDYSPIRSEIVDYLMAPIFAWIEKDEIELDLPSSVKEIIGSALDDMFEMRQLLDDLKPKIVSNYLSHGGYPVAFYAYRIILQKGIAPQSIEEVLEEISRLNTEECQMAIELCLDYRGEKKEKQVFTSYLDELPLKADEKWYWFQAYTNPKVTFQRIVEILREVTAIYRPYYEKYASETKAYATNLDLNTLLSSEGFGDVEKIVTDSKEGVEVYVLTPMQIRLSYISIDDDELSCNAIFFSTKIDELVNVSRKVDISNLTIILKQLGDETRYKVLLAILGGNIKSKDIAEQLGITAAAVSFHTQKLLNAQILMANKNDNNIKYLLNKKLLSDIIDKLKEDFKLED